MLRSRSRWSRNNFGTWSRNRNYILNKYICTAVSLEDVSVGMELNNSLERKKIQHAKQDDILVVFLLNWSAWWATSATVSAACSGASSTTGIVAFLLNWSAWWATSATVSAACSGASSMTVIQGAIDVDSSLSSWFWWFVVIGGLHIYPDVLYDKRLIPAPVHLQLPMMQDQCTLLEILIYDAIP